MPRVGDLHIECATCSQDLYVPIEAEMRADEEGGFSIYTSADTSGLWLHAWSEHEGGV